MTTAATTSNRALPCASASRRSGQDHRGRLDESKDPPKATDAGERRRLLDPRR
ncbi:unnamed protein product [Ectocarpus sp. 13 AM-2016]